MERKSPAAHLDRSVFVVGPHRSGTTLLYEILGRHPHLGYLNNANRRFRNFPLLARLMTGTVFQDRPMEAQKFWDRFWTGKDDVMGSEEATDEAVAWYRETIGKILSLRGARRFVAKYPRLSLRLHWIDAVFPGALFVHILRDWRAVVNSSLKRRAQRERHGGGRWYGVRIPGWQEMGDLPPEIVAGRQYLFVTRTLERDGPGFGGRFFTVRYTDLCRGPVETLKKIADRCDLEWSPRFEKGIPRNLRSANHKWRTDLDPAKVERIRAEDPEFFAAHEEEE